MDSTQIQFRQNIREFSWIQYVKNNAASLAMMAWIFTPEVRRIVDWKSSFHNVSIFSVIPLLVLLPGMALFKNNFARVGNLFKLTLGSWLIALGYGFFISVMGNNVAAAAYELLNVLTPLGIVGYLLASKADFFEELNKLADTLLWASCLASFYGIFQYIQPPAWDIQWLASTGIVSMGDPVPFGLRIWGPTNSTGALAQLIVFGLMLNLPRLNLRQWQQYVAIVPMIIALLLTLSRTCWLQLVMGLCIYLIFSPQRKDFIVAFLGGALLVGSVGWYVSSHNEAAGDSINSIVARMTTFNDLSSDDSYVTRQEILRNGLQSAIANPLGEGLGMVGTAAKLGSSGNTVDFDNGYLARYYETGVIGGIATLIGIALPLVLTIRSRFASSMDPEKRSFVTVAIVIQGMMIFGMVSEDVYIGLPGIFFWIAIAIASKTRSSQPGLSQA